MAVVEDEGSTWRRDLELIAKTELGVQKVT